MLLEAHLVLFLLFIATLTGFVKSGLPALGALISVVMVSVFPPRDALGLLLFYLLAGDIVAVSLYHRQAKIKELKSMLPMVFLGIISGIAMLNFVSNDALGLIIGIMIVCLISMEPFREKVHDWANRNKLLVRSGSGWLAGLTTTIGNAAGPILSLYLLLLKLDKHSFTGTVALFFLTVNIIKLPLYASVGIFKSYYMWTLVLTLPMVFVGAFFGYHFLRRIPQVRFTQIILIMTGLAGVSLILRYFFL